MDKGAHDAGYSFNFLKFIDYYFLIVDIISWLPGCEYHLVLCPRVTQVKRRESYVQWNVWALLITIYKNMKQVQ